MQTLVVLFLFIIIIIIITTIIIIYKYDICSNYNHKPIHYYLILAITTRTSLSQTKVLTQTTENLHNAMKRLKVKRISTGLIRTHWSMLSFCWTPP